MRGKRKGESNIVIRKTLIKKRYNPEWIGVWEGARW
jgi:hypothetical protein